MAVAVNSQLNPLENAERQFEEAAARLKLDAGIMEMLKRPRRATIQWLPWMYQLSARVCWNAPWMLSGMANSTPVSAHCSGMLRVNIHHLSFMVISMFTTKASAGIMISTPDTEAKDLSHSGIGAPIRWWAPGVE